MASHLPSREESQGVSREVEAVLWTGGGNAVLHASVVSLEKGGRATIRSMHSTSSAANSSSNSSSPLSPSPFPPSPSSSPSSPSPSPSSPSPKKKLKQKEGSDCRVMALTSFNLPPSSQPQHDNGHLLVAGMSNGEIISYQYSRRHGFQRNGTLLFHKTTPLCFEALSFPPSPEQQEQQQPLRFLSGGSDGTLAFWDVTSLGRLILDSPSPPCSPSSSQKGQIFTEIRPSFAMQVNQCGVNALSYQFLCWEKEVGYGVMVSGGDDQQLTVCLFSFDFFVGEGEERGKGGVKCHLTKAVKGAHFSSIKGVVLVEIENNNDNATTKTFLLFSVGSDQFLKVWKFCVCLDPSLSSPSPSSPSASPFESSLLSGKKPPIGMTIEELLSSPSSPLSLHHLQSIPVDVSDPSTLSVEKMKEEKEWRVLIGGAGVQTLIVRGC